MQRGCACGAIGLFLIASLFFAGCSDLHPAQPAQEKMSPGDLQMFVQDAAEYAGHTEKEMVLSQFNQKDGPFSHGDLYIYAYDYNGTLLAHPYQLEHVGTNRMNWTDARGLPAIRIGAHVAANGGGFIAYLYPSPSGGEINESFRDSYVPKIGYVCPAGDDWWVASGIYFTDSDEGGDSAVPNAVSEMITLVERGVLYGRDQGETTAFAEISNKSGIFVDADAHYLYAYDYNGTLLAHPHIPASIGSSLIDRQDPFGMKMIRALADTAYSGGGYVVFVWPNPEKENRQELKIGYVLPVDERWWIGSGVYLSEITGVDTSFPVPSP